ncbi:MAG TPA: HlyD family efflux transporter periplasmic adaptor subunit [Nevskiaceae bacterium]|nr:HlyD family efflux transporter periplasmic adaptor subunit [Nevskiaceae bacterium]
MSEASTNAEAAEPSEPSTRQRHRKQWIIGIIVIFAIGLIGYGVYYFLYGQFHVTTEDAYVHGNLVQLTPQIPDTVVSIGADDTDLVHAGQPVVILDHSNQTIALETAKADLGRAVRKVLVLHQQADGERATIALRQATLEQRHRDYLRDKGLLAVHGVTVEQFQHAQTAYLGAQQELAHARHQLRALQAQIDAPSLRQVPQVALAIANLRMAWLNMRRTTIPAPVTGYVAQRSVQVGKRVTVGEPLLTIVPLHDLWVEANFKETQLTDVRIGQPATVTADLYGGSVTYHGKVVGISAGTGAAFELLPPQNATGNWIKVMRRVPVRISLNPKDLEKHPLRIGLSLSVDVDIKDSNGPALAQLPPSRPVYETKVYDVPQPQFETLVSKIIKDSGGVNTHSS